MKNPLLWREEESHPDSTLGPVWEGLAREGSGESQGRVTLSFETRVGVQDRTYPSHWNPHSDRERFTPHYTGSPW